MRKIILLSSAVVLLAGLALLLRPDHRKQAAACDERVTETLARNGLTRKNLEQESARPQGSLTARWELREKEYLVPASRSLDRLKQAVEKDLPENLRVWSIRTIKDKHSQVLVLEIAFKQLKVYRLKLRQKAVAGLLAIVLDDWGYSLSVFEMSLKIKQPLTYAILPGLAYSGEISARLRKFGREFILHLPMEPHNSGALRLEKNTLMCSMSAEEIRETFRRQAASLNGIRGVNNHMGSRATEDERVLGVLFEEILRGKLFFLDSYTTENSRAARLAKQKNTPFLQRDVFLDNNNDRDAIRKQLQQAAAIALSRGKAVAIGHARPLTLEVLQETLPQLEKKGIKLVHLSQLL